MKQKKVLLGAVLAVFLAAGNLYAGGGGESTTGGNFTINISHIVNEDNSWHKASVFFKDYVEKGSNGAIKVNVYPNSQLGTEIDAINSIISNGDTDITITGESMQTVIPEMGLVGIPYLITSAEMLHKVAGGPIGKQLEDLMIRKANMRSLAYFERGPRNVTSNKAIRTPADLRGFVIRISASKIHAAAFEAMGAKPTPMAFAEVFTALQQKTIEGQENPHAMIKTGNFYELQRFLNKTEHVRSWIYFVFKESKFQSMPKNLQDLVIDAGKRTQAREHELYLEDEKSLEQFLTSHGMTMVNDVDQAAFANLARQGVESVLPPEMKPMYDQIRAMR